jgi:transposase
MRGHHERQAEMLFGETADALIPRDHPLRAIRVIVDAALAQMSERFASMYAPIGRPSVPPEHLLKASLLMALYSIPSERRLCMELRYNLLFKWFLDLNIREKPFDPTTFSQNRERLMNTDLATTFLGLVVAEARRRQLLSSDHFSVDGTLIEAWASTKSFRPRDGEPPSSPPAGGRNAEVNFHGERRTNETHASTTDPEARLARKGRGQAAKLSYLGHILIENRSGLIVDAMLTQASGTAERDAALVMVKRTCGRRRRITLGADKGYDTRQFVADCRDAGVTPHVAQNNSRRRSAIDGRTAHHPGYALSQRVRKRVEEPFGWAKTVALIRKLRFIGQRRNEFWFKLVMAGYDLVRMANIEARAAV